jgi:hypothetical protein
MNWTLAGLAIVAAVVIVEIILSAKWNPSYFTFGIPIFVRRVERSTRLDNVPLEKLTKSAATMAAAPLLFERLGPNTIAFREKAFAGSMHYSPIMRGLIKSSVEEAAVTVVGLVNWSVLAVLIYFIAVLGWHFRELAPVVIGVFAILYFIQAVRFSRVARALREDTAA